MSANSKIEWTDHTFNPWIGCTKVDEACANCYAERDDKRRHWTQDGWGEGKPRKRTSAANWKQPLKWNYDAADPKLGTRKDRPRVFCASLADWLDDEVPIEWLADLLTLIHATPNLDWLLLTKRTENWRERIARVGSYFALYGRGPHQDAGIAVGWLNGIGPSNVWIGTSVGTQKSADLRIPQLLSIPARIRFLSCEPMLGPLNLFQLWLAWPSGIKPIHWVICGGESGPHARPMHPDWARSLRDQCATAVVPFFFKQWGEILHCTVVQDHPVSHLKKPIVTDTPFPEICYRYGKKDAGRLLDGREWNEFLTHAR